MVASVPVSSMPKGFMLRLTIAAGLVGALWSIYALHLSNLSLLLVAAVLMILNALIFFAFGTDEFKSGIARWVKTVQKKIISVGSRQAQTAPGAPPPERRKSRQEASAPQDGVTSKFPSYTREEVEDGIQHIRASLASSVFSDPVAAANLKDKLHYLHCYRLAYMSSTSQDPHDKVKQLAVSHYIKQRDLLGGVARDKGIRDSGNDRGEPARR